MHFIHVNDLFKLLVSYEFASFLKNVKMNNSAKGGNEEAGCGDSETDTLDSSVGIAVENIVLHTVVHCLARTLTVSESEEQARRFKHARDEDSNGNRYNKTENALQEISRYRGNTRVKYFNVSALVQVGFRSLQR